MTTCFLSSQVLVFQAERTVPCQSVKKSGSAHLNHDIDSSPARADRFYVSDSAHYQGSRNSLRGSIDQVRNDLIMKISHINFLFSLKSP